VYKRQIEDASKDLNKLLLDDGKWYYTSSSTKVINANGADDAETVSIKDLLDYVEDGTDVTNAYVKLDGNKVAYILMDDANVEATAEDMAMVIEKYYSSSKYYVRVDIRGDVAPYELESSGDYSSIDADTMYEYSMSGSKIDLDVLNPVDATVDYTVYGEVTDVDEDYDSFEVADILANLALDEDSYVYDMTGSDPVYVSDITGISDGDFVFVIEVDGVADPDRKGIADVVLIVDKADYPSCDWVNGDTQ
jgi:hypothetical protein